MSKITAVRSCAVSVPLARPPAFSTRQVATREFVLVEIESDHGMKGIGFTYGGNRAASITLAAVRDLLGPVLLGEDPFRVEGLWDAMYKESLLQGRVGAVMRGLSALDIALWDHNARVAGLPLYRYLGAYTDGAVRAYASGGYYYPDGGVDELAAEFAGYVEDGFEGAKMKVGRLSLPEEVERLAAVREAMGSERAVMLDCNNGWSELETAAGFARALEPFEPYWLEEPFSPDDVDNHARLAQRTSIPIATGEIEAGRWRFTHLIESGAATILQPDAVCCGGITEFRRIGAIAAGHGIAVCPHAYHELHAHLTAAMPNAPWTECFVDNRILNFCDLIDGGPRVAGGKIHLPSGPGLGFSFREDVLARTAIDAWSDARA